MEFSQRQIVINVALVTGKLFRIEISDSSQKLRCILKRSYILDNTKMKQVKVWRTRTTTK